MAEKFGDEECKKKLMQAPNVQTAEEAVKNIQKFDSKVGMRFGCCFYFFS